MVRGMEALTASGAASNEFWPLLGVAYRGLGKLVLLPRFVNAVDEIVIILKRRFVLVHNQNAVYRIDHFTPQCLVRYFDCLR